MVADITAGVAQVSVALCYMHGLGVERNVDIGREWLQEAKAQGHADAIMRLLRFEEELERDPAEIAF